jgi:hypothetical protein
MSAADGCLLLLLLPSALLLLPLPPLQNTHTQAALYDVLALMEQGKAYNAETKIAHEVATLTVRGTHWLCGCAGKLRF